MGERNQLPATPDSAEDTGAIKEFSVSATRQALHADVSASADSKLSLPLTRSGRRSFLCHIVTITGGALLTAGVDLTGAVRAHRPGAHAEAHFILDSNGQPILEGNGQVIQGTKRNA